MTSLWHPFGDMNLVSKTPFILDRGEGVYVYDRQGKQYLDVSASLWYVNVGYGRKEVVSAVASQMEKLHAFHTFTDFANEPALRLAERIASVSPDPDSKIFFGSGGSDAVDTAAKLARRYCNQIGQPERTVFIAREFAYHGMNTYGTSLGGMEPNRMGYGDLVSDVVFVPYDDLEAVEKAIDHAGPERIAGMICEAVIGAGGVRPVPTDYLKGVRDLIRQAGGLYIADEVITGFGRVGDWFAANRFNLEPDLITFAKGVTSGYVPLGGVIASPRVAAPFYEKPGVVWRHGYTYSGHPAACAAGLVVMDIYEREGLFQRAMELETELLDALRPLTDIPIVETVRGGVGAMAAVQVEPEVAVRAAELCREHGLLTRVMVGGGLQVSPPLTFTRDHVEEMATKFREGLSQV